MKSHKDIEKIYEPEEIAESYVFPNGLNSSQRAQSLEIFQKWRKKNESNRSDKSKLITRLFQLKFIMDDYINKDEYRKELDFSYFS